MFGMIGMAMLGYMVSETIEEKKREKKERKMKEQLKKEWETKTGVYAYLKKN